MGWVSGDDRVTHTGYVHLHLRLLGIIAGDGQAVVVGHNVGGGKGDGDRSAVAGQHREGCRAERENGV